MTPPPFRVGWIGTGRMGAALVHRLLDAGHDVAVYNRTRSKTDALAEHGAKIVDAPVDLAGRDVVFIMVSGSADMTHVTTGEGGLLTDPAAVPRIVVDSSTVSPQSSADARARAEARGARFLAAPVSGNPKVVRAGRLTLAVSGPRDAYDEVIGLLLALGRGATYLGDGEVARLAKICHNVFLGVVIQSLTEITLLAERGGTTRAAFLEFLNDSVMGSIFTRYKSPALVNLDFTPTFTMPLLKKDFDLAYDVAHDLDVPMPLASAAAQLVASAVGAGHRELDFATLILEQARRAGMTLESENAEVDDGLST
ncbi:MAG TPA: NAD(P)-dependent oxidoreductase [Pseudonocardiaceae bacterium]|jgi:3-hydroxyisobutyrate dehydrogenase-like beta-hydroxyacid dehydrogenase|nr:NAD(P)-dependent oxidoreductase [Pseudonocardiaceae bacterium]